MSFTMSRKFAHVQQVRDAIQPSHPLSSPSPPALNLSQHQGDPECPAEFHGSKHLQFSSVAQSCPTLCDPMNRSTPGLPVHHKLPEFTQTRAHVWLICQQTRLVHLSCSKYSGVRVRTLSSPTPRQIPCKTLMLSTLCHGT